MLLFTKIRTGFFRDTEAKSFTCRSGVETCHYSQEEGADCSPQLLAWAVQATWQPTQRPFLTSSVMVAEKSIVCRWWEQRRIISFICSSKYSSSILERREAVRCGSWSNAGLPIRTRHTLLPCDAGSPIAWAGCTCWEWTWQSQACTTPAQLTCQPHPR